jgi:hypothetical protein
MIAPILLAERLRRPAHRARRVALNAWIDRRHGSVLAAHRTSTGWTIGVQNSDYAALEQIFRNRIRPVDVLVDVGCSTGRVINLWLEQGPSNRIVGLEADGGRPGFRMSRW